MICDRNAATELDGHVQQELQDKVCVLERVAVISMEWACSRLRRCLPMLEVVPKLFFLQVFIGNLYESKKGKSETQGNKM